MRNKTIAVPSASTIIIVVAPLLLSLLPILSPGEESTCAYIILVLAVLWVTTALPIAVTGMLAVPLFSAAGILTLKQITDVYFIPGFWLFFGSMIMAIAVQANDLHTRIALKILLVVGTDPKRLLFGFMLTSHVLSMFIANIPVTSMLLPIAESVLTEMKPYAKNAKRLQKTTIIQKDQQDETLNDTKGSVVYIVTDAAETESHSLETHMSTSTARPEGDTGLGQHFVPHPVDRELVNRNSDEEIDASTTSIVDQENCTLNSSVVGEDDNEELKSLTRAITLCIPYSSLIGGVSTLTGSALNIVAVSLIQSLFPRSELIPFGTWFFYCAPGSLLITLLGYVWLCFLHVGFRKKKTSAVNPERIRQLLLRKYKKLGSITWAQGWIIFFFVLTTILWFTRSPGFFPGWGRYFREGYMAEGTVAMASGLMMFFIPKEKPVFYGTRNGMFVKRPKILTYKQMEQMFCWDVIFVAGGGLTIAAAATESGLSSWIASQALQLQSLPVWVICLVTTSFAIILTECATSLAIMSILMPVLAKMAVVMRLHPYYLCLPTFLASTQAFMFPVSSPVNTIAYSFKLFTMKDMIKSGWMMNIIGLTVINLSINTYGKVVLDVDNFPDWAEPTNSTL